jgi:hypothetical protein
MNGWQPKGNDMLSRLINSIWWSLTTWTVCAWCGGTVMRRPLLPVRRTNKNTSHGMCPRCREGYRRELLRMNPKMIGK